MAVGPVLAGGGGVTRHAAVPPGPGADDPVDIVVLGESHHLGPGLLVRDAAGASKEAFVIALKRPCCGPWASDFGEGGSCFLGDNGGDAEEEKAGNDHDDGGDDFETGCGLTWPDVPGILYRLASQVRWRANEFNHH